MGNCVRCTCPKGVEYPSISAMCEAYGASESRYRYRVKAGWTIEKALSVKEHGNGKETTCPKGVEYRSFSAMCKAYKVNRKVVESRMNMGFTLEEVLAQLKNNHIKTRKRGKCEDHLGQVFSSVTEMCAHWSVVDSTYFCRLRKGYSVEDALTLKGKGHSRAPKPTVDHLGTLFPSETKMCAHWNISVKTYNADLLKGLSLEEILTKPRPQKKQIQNKKAKQQPRRQLEWPEYRGVPSHVIAKAHKRLLSAFHHHYDSWGDYVENTLLWTNEDFLGFTEDGFVVLRQDNEITTLEFSKYIDALLNG